MKPKTLLIAALSLFFAFASHSFATDSYYFNLPPIVGPVDLKGLKHNIIITGFDLTHDAAGQTGLSIQKPFDATSIDIANALVSGSSFSTATLTVTKAGPSAQTIFVMQFTDLAIGGNEIIDSGAADAAPVENVNFSFSQVVITSYKSDPRGGTTAGPSVTIITNPGH